MVSLPVPVTANEYFVQTAPVLGSDWLNNVLPSQEALKSLGSSPTEAIQKLKVYWAPAVVAKRLTQCSITTHRT
jgi:hypothetical protein